MNSVFTGNHICDSGAGGCGFFGNFGLGFWGGHFACCLRGEVSWSVWDEVEEERQREKEVPSILRYGED